MNSILLGGYAAYCGFVWLLRGGKFGAIARGIGLPEPGTTITRIACSGLMALPLAYGIGFWALAVWPFIWLSMTVGYFDESMGLEQPWRDHFWLAAWGGVVAGIMTGPLVLAHFANYPVEYPFVYYLGVLAVVAYATQKPIGRALGLDWTERAEILTGVIFGLVLWLAYVGA